MGDRLEIISVDIETTGLEIGKHVPISIGAVRMNVPTDTVDHDNSFYVQLEWDSLIVDPKALRVNQLNIVNPPGDGDIFCRSLPAKVALEKFVAWLGLSSLSRKSSIIPMGKNIGSFDLPMLKSIWSGPNGQLLWPFGYRSIDLNTMFFVLSDSTGESFVSIKNRISNAAWSLQDDLFGDVDIGKHHALADAWWNVFAYQECMKLFNPSNIIEDNGSTKTWG